MIFLIRDFSSEIKGLSLVKFFCKILQNLLYLSKTKHSLGKVWPNKIELLICFRTSFAWHKRQEYMNHILAFKENLNFD